jgi:hypothetical protein
MTVAEVISGLALIVSGIAAYYAYRAPIRAERLRSESAQSEREMLIFTLLMSERGRWGCPAMLQAMNSVKVVFRDNSTILDKWFICYSKVGSPTGSPDQYYDLLAAIGEHIGLPMRREDLENFFINPTEQKETALRTAQIHRAFSELSANTAITTIAN